MDTQTTSTIHAKMEWITPDTARAWLENSHALQRSIRVAHVKTMCRAMKGGLWRPNGEPIILSETGTVIDGHHRLQAVLLSGCGVMFLVVRGVSKDDYGTIDSGIIKTTGDLLQIDGFASHKQSAAVAAMMIVLGAAARRGYTTCDWPRRDDIRAYAKDHRDVVSWAADLCVRCSRAGLRPPAGLAGAIGFLALHADEPRREQLSSFADRVISGEELIQGDPELALRAKVIAGKIKAIRQSRDVILQVALYTVMAWGTVQRGDTTTLGGKLRCHGNNDKMLIFPQVFMGRRRLFLLDEHT